MLEFLRHHLELAHKALFTATAKIAAFYEWYTHSIDFMHLHTRSAQSQETVFFEDDDEEASEDFDIYFNEYDWEREKRGRRDV